MRSDETHTLVCGLYTQIGECVHTFSLGKTDSANTCTYILKPISSYLHTYIHTKICQNIHTLTHINAHMHVLIHLIMHTHTHMRLH